MSLGNPPCTSSFFFLHFGHKKIKGSGNKLHILYSINMRSLWLDVWYRLELLCIIRIFLTCSWNQELNELSMASISLEKLTACSWSAIYMWTSRPLLLLLWRSCMLVIWLFFVCFTASDKGSAGWIVFGGLQGWERRPSPYWGGGHDRNGAGRG